MNWEDFWEEDVALPMQPPAPADVTPKKLRRTAVASPLSQKKDPAPAADSGNRRGTSI